MLDSICGGFILVGMAAIIGVIMWDRHIYNKAKRDLEKVMEELERKLKDG